MVNDKLYSINQIYELFEIENFNLNCTLNHKVYFQDNP